MSGLYAIAVELERYGSKPWHVKSTAPPNDYETKARWDKRRHVVLTISVDRPDAGHTDAEALASAVYLAGVIARATLWLVDEVTYESIGSPSLIDHRSTPCATGPNEDEEDCGHVNMNDDVTIVNDERAKDWPTPSVSITVPRETADLWLTAARELIAEIVVSDRKQPQRLATPTRGAHADAKAPTIRNTEQTRASR